MGLNTHFGQEDEPAWEIDFAKAGDSAGIEEVRRQAWIETYPDPTVGLTLEDINSLPFGSQEKLVKWEQSIEGQGEGKRIWVARENEKVVGFAVAERAPEKHELNAIYVLPTHHGRGIGKALMQSALAWLGNDRDAVVWVFSHNKDAIGFYRKNQFEESGETSSLDINGKPIPDLEMIRKGQGFTETKSEGTPPAIF